MKRKPAITIRMSAAHWDVTIHGPTLDLGAHLPEARAFGGTVPFGIFRA